MISIRTIAGTASAMRHIRTISLTLALVVALGDSSRAATQVTTTTYQYNSDRALTAVTTQVDGGAASTVYLVYDNFVPSASDPTSGTVLAGNGNLTGIGPATSGAYTTSFQYDQRNRLTAAATASQSVSYTYDASSRLASSTLGSDSLDFYFDNAANGPMANLNQKSTGVWSSYLGNVTYLSDGTEQMLCSPRKDIAGVFDASAQSFAPVRYDPYGATANGSPAAQSTYDLKSNPLLYTGQYQDPTWLGYYLRHRWYLPAYQTFLSRDPVDKMHRYGYATGDPIGRIDPSGLYSVENSARRFLRDLHAGGNGARGTAARFFLGGIIGITQIIAHPAAYWHEIVRDSHGLTAFLAIGVFAEIGTGGWGPFYDLAGSYTTRFLTRHAIDLGVGGSAAAFSSYQHGRFDWRSFAQGIEYTAGGIFWARDLGGFGYKPFDMSAKNVDDMIADHVGSGSNDVLVFRQRSAGFTAKTTPLAERFGIGNYHEGVFAVGREGSWFGNINVDDSGQYIWKTAWGDTPWPARAEAEYQFVGTYRADAVKTAFLDRAGAEAHNQYELEQRANGKVEIPEPNYSKYFNNCQQNAARLRQQIMALHAKPLPEIEDFEPIDDGQ